MGRPLPRFNTIRSLSRVSQQEVFVSPPSYAEPPLRCQPPRKALPGGIGQRGQKASFSGFSFPWKGLGLLLLACALLASPRPATAQITLFKMGGQPLVLTGSMRTRDYLWSFFNPGPLASGSYQNQYNYGANVLRMGLGYQTHGLRIFGEIMNPSLIALPNNALAPAPGGALGLGANYYSANDERYGTSIFLKQAFAEYHANSAGGFDLKGGRFEFGDGVDIVPADPQLRWIILNEIQQRLIGNFGFTDVMRSLDGGMVRYGQSSWNATALAAIPTQGVFGLHGMDEVNHVSVVYAALNGGPNAEWGKSVGRVFFIHYNDGRGLIPVDDQPAALAAANRLPISIETLGVDWAHVVAAGPGGVDIMGWGAYQFGSWGNQSQSAYAYVAQIGYRLNNTPWKPWVRAEYTVGSADHDPTGRVHGTFFQILPTPRLYALDPFYNMMNIRDAAAELLLDPSKSLEWRTTVHGLWLDSSHDRWYSGGGASNNTVFGYAAHPSFGHQYLATVSDTGITWKANPHLAFSIYLGHAFGGSVVKANYAGNHEENLAFAESNIAF